MASARDIVDDALATAMHAMQTTVATTLRSAPGSLTFARDMFLNVPLIADWQSIARLREHHVNENLHQAIRKHYQFDYTPGQQVLKKVHDPSKLGVEKDGLYSIEHVHVDGNLTIILYPSVIECINVSGNLTIILHPGVTEHINIDRVIPYC